MAALFFLSYISAELRRRRGRTLLTALGLAVGVGLVATVTALSQGLDDAQGKVLKPLTGVGTDMSVSRPVGQSRDEMQKENGGGRIGLRNAGNPGDRFSREDLVSSQVSFAQSKPATVRAIDGVKSAAASLTLDRLQVSGTVPEQPPGGGRFGGPGGPPGGPDSIDFKQSTISGVDTTQPDLALVTPGRVEAGKWFGDGASHE